MPLAARVWPQESKEFLSWKPGEVPGTVKPFKPADRSSFRAPAGLEQRAKVGKPMAKHPLLKPNQIVRTC